MKKILCRISMFVLLICLCGSIFVSAVGVSDNYIEFNNPNSRIDDDGSFEFQFYFSCPSDRFVANSSRITIQTRAMVQRQDIGIVTSDDLFTLTLYKKNVIGTTEIGQYTGCADNVYGGKTFNVTEGETYYFQLDPADPNFQMTGKRFVGTGNITNVSVIN